MAAYDASPGLVLACDGPELRVCSANATARSVLAQRPGSGGLGSALLDLLPELEGQLPLELAHGVLATGDPVTLTDAPVQVRAPHGGLLDLTWTCTLSPWRRADGSVRGVVVHGSEAHAADRARPAAAAAAVGQPDDFEPVLSLQDALLPSWLPVLPGLELAGRYVLAPEPEAAGGDWFDALALEDGRVALVVGDVVGHGVTASAAMGQLRTVAQERLRDGAGVAGAVRAMDELARHVPEARAATACVLVLDPGNGEVEYCTAGHPPPLLVPADVGRARYLPLSGAAPLATSGDLTTEHSTLWPDDLLLLYTDGLLDGVGEDLTQGTVTLGEAARAAARRAGGSVDRVCDAALRLVSVGTGSDDVTVLAAQLCAPVEPLHLHLRADATALDTALARLRDWLQRLRVRELDHVVVEHAVEELVANVVEHAYAEAQGAGPGRPEGDRSAAGRW